MRKIIVIVLAALLARFTAAAAQATNDQMTNVQGGGALTNEVQINDSLNADNASDRPVEILGWPSSSTLSASVSPGYDLGGLGMYNFSFAGIFNYITTAEPVISFLYQLAHQSAVMYFPTNTSGEIKPAYLLPVSNCYDLASGTFLLFFLKYFNASAGCEYTVFRALDHANTPYNYNKLAVNCQLTLDMTRPLTGDWGYYYSYMFPGKGFYITAGYQNNFNFLTNGQVTPFMTASAQYQHYFPLSADMLFTLRLYGKSVVGSAPDISSKPVTVVTGAYQIPGDYVLDAVLEYRFLSQWGLTLDVPGFLPYMPNFSFKFSPGALAGVDAGCAGYFNSGSLMPQYSAYITPLIAISMVNPMWVDIAVLRFDFSISSSMAVSCMFSISFGTIGTAKTSPMFQQPL